MFRLNTVLLHLNQKDSPSGRSESSSDVEHKGRVLLSKSKSHSSSEMRLSNLSALRRARLWILRRRFLTRLPSLDSERVYALPLVMVFHERGEYKYSKMCNMTEFIPPRVSRRCSGLGQTRMHNVGAWKCSNRCRASCMRPVQRIQCRQTMRVARTQNI